MEGAGLIQIVDAAMAEAARKSGAWLLCRPGCAECCLGPFSISEQDALRLRFALEQLAASDAARASRILQRAAQFRDGDDEPCPVLDPATKTCELYEARPLTCRLFGPPVRGAEGVLGVCELCFDGASEAEIAACEAEMDTAVLEALGHEDEAYASVAEALLARR